MDERSPSTARLVQIRETSPFCSKGGLPQTKPGLRQLYPIVRRYDIFRHWTKTSRSLRKRQLHFRGSRLEDPLGFSLPTLTCLCLRFTSVYNCYIASSHFRLSSRAFLIVALTFQPTVLLLLAPNCCQPALFFLLCCFHVPSFILPPLPFLFPLLDLSFLLTGLDVVALVFFFHGIFNTHARCSKPKRCAIEGTTTTKKGNTDLLVRAGAASNL